MASTGYSSAVIVHSRPFWSKYDGDELADALRSSSRDEFDLEARRQRESARALPRGDSGDAFAPASVGSGRAAWTFSGRRAGQFFDGDVLHLHERLAAAVDLDADLARLHDLRIGLGVVDALHAIDPRGDARAVGADDVFVPVVLLEHRTERLHVRLRHHLVAPRLSS